MRIWLTRKRREALAILLLCFAGGLVLGALLPSCLPRPSRAEAAAAAPEQPLEPEGSILVLRRSQPQPEEGRPTVVIYCTHTSEGYAGQERVNGRAGGVMNVAQALAQAFEGYDVDVILDTSLHDKSYDEAYTSSLASISAIARLCPEAEVYIDVHRDSAIEGVSTTLTTDQGSYARMMFVVGTDEKMEHPRWRENYAFAMAIEEELERMQPGLMRTARVYSGRYNQHIASGAILVEVGSTDNTIAQGMASAALLAEAICTVKGW